MNKTKWKLSPQEVKELKFLYIHQGWNEQHLSKKYGIKQQSVQYHVKNLIRIVDVLKEPPEEVRHLYISYTRPRVKVKTYKDYLKESDDRKKVCVHSKWITRCSCCGEIINSDSFFSRHLRGTVTNELDSSVTAHNLTSV